METIRVWVGLKAPWDSLPYGWVWFSKREMKSQPDTSGAKAVLPTQRGRGNLIPFIPFLNPKAASRQLSSECADSEYIYSRGLHHRALKSHKWFLRVWEGTIKRLSTAPLPATSPKTSPPFLGPSGHHSTLPFYFPTYHPTFLLSSYHTCPYMYFSASSIH